MKFQFFNSNNRLRNIADSDNNQNSLLFKIRIWTADEVADFLDVTVGHIYNLVNRREIPFKQKGKGGRLYFIPQEIFDWIFEEVE
ncbi:MAG: helix-turn-helix domain-containing protein [Halobacteriovoraceae bacterium]|nr:helix-turn-helix domain-containing protein [Halobacteriovoraceae bacterium]